MNRPRISPALRRWRIWFYIGLAMAGDYDGPITVWGQRWKEWGAL